MKKLMKNLKVNNSVHIYLRCNQTMKLFFLACILSSISMTANTVHAENKKNKLDSAIIKGLTSGEYVILLRHALAPGFGDPNSFDVSDCLSQRNLSEQGRQQAIDIGKLLKANGIQQASIFSSQWCRCIETAQLLDLGKVSALPIINSFYQRFERKTEQTQQLKEWLIRNNRTNKNPVSSATILVTHQVNISAIANVFANSGEIVIIKTDNFGKVTVMAQVQTSQ